MSGEVAENKALTLTQARVVEVLASGTARTVTEAAKLAGVARESVHRLSRNTAVQRAVEKRKAELAGKARDLKAVSASKLSARLHSEDASDALLLGTYKTANDVLASGVEEDAVEQASAADYASARAKLMQAVRVGRYLERRSRRCPR